MPQLVRKLHRIRESTMRTIFAAAFSLAFAVAPTASAQRPDRNVEQPIVRTFNWFSYVGGDDIRSACVPGGRNRVRLVYNALWEEQVRVYDVFLQPDGTAGLDIGVLDSQGHVLTFTDHALS